MYWGKLATIFFLATFKFMFAPAGGPALGLSFWETYFAAISGGLFCASIFYFAAGYFMRRAQQKRVDAWNAAITAGETPKKRRVFTRLNKFVVRIKRALGIFGTAMWVPLFLSIPLGSIITAKFYGKDKRTFPIIVLGIFVNAMVTTGITYLLAS